jgi:hypothetical protein
MFGAGRSASMVIIDQVDLRRGVETATAMAQRGDSGRHLLTPIGGEVTVAASDTGAHNVLASLSRPSGHVRSDGSPPRMGALVEATLKAAATARCVGARSQGQRT